MTAGFSRFVNGLYTIRRYLDALAVQAVRSDVLCAQVLKRASTHVQGDKRSLHAQPVQRIEHLTI
mgnify:CR=1 FL=1